jgi:hypothetical protein
MRQSGEAGSTEAGNSVRVGIRIDTVPQDRADIPSHDGIENDRGVREKHGSGFGQKPIFLQPRAKAVVDPTVPRYRVTVASFRFR